MEPAMEPAMEDLYQSHLIPCYIKDGILMSESKTALINNASYLWNKADDCTINRGSVDDYKRYDFETTHSYMCRSLFRAKLLEIMEQLVFEPLEDCYVTTVPIGFTEDGEKHTGMTTIFFKGDLNFTLRKTRALKVPKTRYN